MSIRSALPAFISLLAAPAATFSSSMIPDGSGFARSLETGQQVVLLSAFESRVGITPGGWRLEGGATAVADRGIETKIGNYAIRLSGRALGGGSKGDFAIHGETPRGTQALGLWVYTEATFNTQTVGLQVYDAEGEALIHTVDATGGWQWVEVTLDDSTPLTPAYPQNDKNGKADAPLKSVHAVWFAKDAGETSIVIDGLVAACSTGEAGAAFTVTLESPDEVKAGEEAAAFLVVVNPAGEPVTFEARYALDTNAALREQLLPDPELGTNHARSATSRTELKGQIIAENTLVDGELESGADTDWKGKLTEVTEFVELDRPRTITAMGFHSGDANWLWKVDVSTSLDGTTYAPVEGLQNFTMHKLWGAQRFPIAAPFEAKYLRFRYHDEGRERDVFRMPSELTIYDGVADESWALPRGDREVKAGKVTAIVAARSFEMVELDLGGALGPGAYLVSYEASTPRRQSGGRPLFVGPSTDVAGSPDSPFGVNASTQSMIASHRELGMGWARFENLKWPFYSPTPGRYDFSGAVGPWHVKLDEMLKEFEKYDISVIPFLFQSAKYASSAPEDLPEGRRMSYPPDDEKFAEFCFQVAARYGHREHPSDMLLTDDKLSGLGLLEVYEIWNEPNLNDPGWGPWVSDLDRYMQMLRPAVEAIKRADPDAKVSNGGWAGLTVEINEPLITHTYADGKRPLDIIDILNVHHYNGREAPEVATINRNIYRSGESGPAALTYLEEMQRLVAWRDEQRPGLPIWMTEMGHDTGGPIGINERLQAARLPRGTMLALLAGFEKVFIYREAGSTPSLHAAAGFFRNDGSKKPSWFTYATLIRQLDGAAGPRRLAHDDPNVWMIAWEKGGETIVTAWTVEGESPLGVDLGDATVVDAFGAERSVTLGDDFVLTDMPIYIHGIANRVTFEAMATRQAAIDAEKAAAAKRLAETEVHLYDFGTAEHVGTMLLGTMRKYTVVGKDDVYDARRGYGFSQPGTQVDDAHWIKDDLARDGVRVTTGTTFRADLPAGRYDLRFNIEPLSETRNVTLAGVKDGPQTFAVSKGDDNSSHAVAIEATGEPIALSADGWMIFRSVAFVPAAP